MVTLFIYYNILVPRIQYLRTPNTISSYPEYNILVPRIQYPRTPNTISSYPEYNILVPRIQYPRTPPNITSSYPGSNPKYPRTNLTPVAKPLYPGNKPLYPGNKPLYPDIIPPNGEGTGVYPTLEKDPLNVQDPNKQGVVIVGEVAVTDKASIVGQDSPEIVKK